MSSEVLWERVAWNLLPSILKVLISRLAGNNEVKVEKKQRRDKQASDPG